MLALAALLALLAGCEAMTPAECATADWGRRGFDDGSKGQAGRDQGLIAYCQLDNAINEGLAGRSYGGVCPPQLDSNFRIFHQEGYAVQDLRKTVERLQREQRAMDAELRDSKTSDARRAELRELLSRSDRRIADARDALQAAQRHLDRLRNDLRPIRR